MRILLALLFITLAGLLLYGALPFGIVAAIMKYLQGGGAFSAIGTGMSVAFASAVAGMASLVLSFVLNGGLNMKHTGDGGP